MKQVTSTVKAWLPEYSSLTPDQLQKPEAIDQFIYSSVDMRSAGWTYVGEATISVDVVLSPDELIASKIETLREQQKKARAEAEAQVNRLEGMIQNLLAISYTPEAA